MNPRLVRFGILFSGAFWLLVAYAALRGLAGCSSSSAPSVTLAQIPAWRTPSDATVYSPSQVAVEVGRLVPGAQLRFSDNAYTLVSYEWLQAYLSWTWDAALRDGIIYTPESFDCDDFSVLFAVLANRSAARAGLKTAPLIARIVVVLPTAARHELIAVATDRGLFIVEPQPAAGAFRTTPFADYKGKIQSVTLGD